MSKFPPCMTRDSTGRNSGTFRDIQKDLFGIHSMLELSGFGMFSSTPKGTRWFHIVISHLFNMTIHESIPKLKHGFVPCLLVHLTLFIGDCFFDNLLLIQMTSNRLPVTFLKVSNHMLLSQNLPEISKKVLDKDGRRFLISQVHSFRIHGSKKGSCFFFDWTEGDGLAVIEHLDAMGVVGFGKCHTCVFHSVPLGTRFRFFGIPPQKGLHGMRHSFRLIHFLHDRFLDFVVAFALFLFHLFLFWHGTTRLFQITVMLMLILLVLDARTLLGVGTSIQRRISTGRGTGRLLGRR
mmetsp:Transcript_23617/g.42599  ORF Transcript_23617/g.42599 Transcript_23617/m.42599 type:complete len:293 (-) Transcript_23617:158-1036(-)